MVFSPAWNATEGIPYRVRCTLETSVGNWLPYRSMRGVHPQSAPPIPHVEIRWPEQSRPGYLNTRT